MVNRREGPVVELSQGLGAVSHPVPQHDPLRVFPALAVREGPVAHPGVLPVGFRDLVGADLAGRARGAGTAPAFYG